MAGLPIKKNTAYSFEASLVSQADTDIFKTSPTLAAGDVLVSKDGGGFSNITSLPTEIASTGVLIVALTATEMNADRIAVLFHDAAGSEWQDQLVTIETDAVQLTDIPTAAEINAEVVDVLRTDLIPDSYSTDGDQPTFAQAVLEIHQYLLERSVSSTTVTVKKPNGTTTAMTFTIDSATDPTSQTRAS